MTFRLLVWLKTKLAARAISRRKSLAGMLSLALVLVGFAPAWVAAAAAAYGAVVRFGGPAVIVVFAAVQVTWLYAALLLGALTEAFELRRMLRYPIEPRTVYWLNVLATPFDLIALFLLPPLGAVVAACWKVAGAGSAGAAATGALLLVLLTAALLQLLLGLLADLLKHEWARAAGGVLLGLGIFSATWLVQGPLQTARPHAPLLAALDPVVLRTAAVCGWLASASLPAGLVAAALEEHWLSATALGAAAAGLFLVLLRVGARATLRAALDRETRSVATAADRRGAAPRAGARLLDALFAPDVAALVGRDFRTFLRTPQIVMGLCVTPLFIAFFSHASGGSRPGFMAGKGIFMAAFLTLMPALNLSANQFGVDREGVRTLFVLPVSPTRLLFAKNMTIVLLVAIETLAAGVVLACEGRTADPWDALVAILGVFAILPALLAVGNVLSVRSPWRMAFRLGAAPQGAITSAFAQIAVLGAMALLLAAPVVAGMLLFGGGHAVPVAGVLLEGAAAWLFWRLLLDGAGDELLARREQVIDALARPEETG